MIAFVASTLRRCCMLVTGGDTCTIGVICGDAAGDGFLGVVIGGGANRELRDGGTAEEEDDIWWSDA